MKGFSGEFLAGGQGDEPSTLKVVIHIGLHKTATRFFQHYVFSSMAKQGVLFNPESLMVLLHAVYLNPDDETVILRFREELSNIEQKNPGSTLLISKPDIPGDMYAGYQQYAENIILLKKLITAADILYFPRNPADWLQSAYRQSLVKGRGGSIETFLNFRNREFHPKQAAYADGMRNISALDIPVKSIYDQCVESFGENSVSVICFEYVRNHKDDVLENLWRVVGLSEIKMEAPELVKNRSYSALAIRLFCNGAHRSDATRFSDVEFQSRPRRYIHKRLRKTRATAIKHGFDKLCYRDEDLLARHGMRGILEEHYATEYNQLLALSSKTLKLNSLSRSKEKI